jgi:hypothetical protein
MDSGNTASFLFPQESRPWLIQDTMSFYHEFLIKNRNGLRAIKES